MTIIATPLNFSTYPLNLGASAQGPQVGKKLGSYPAVQDLDAATIEALKGGAASGTGSLLGNVQNLQPTPLQLGGQPAASQEKISPDGSVQLQTSAPTLSDQWAAQGVTPPQAGNPESFMGRVMNQVRELGPDWRQQVAAQPMTPVNFK